MAPVPLTDVATAVETRLGATLLQDTGLTGDALVRLALLEIPEYLYDARTDDVYLDRAGNSADTYTDEWVAMVDRISDGHRSVWTQDAADPSRIRHHHVQDRRVRVVVQPLIPGTRAALAADTWSSETVDLDPALQQALLAYTEWQTRDQHETLTNTDRLSGRSFRVEGLEVRETHGGSTGTAATAADNARNRFLQWAQRYRRPGGISG